MRHEEENEEGKHGIRVSEQERNHKEEHDHLHHPGFGGSTEFIGDEVDFERGRLHESIRGSRVMDHQHFERHNHQNENEGEHGMMGYHHHDTMRGNHHIRDQDEHLGIQYIKFVKFFKSHGNP